MCRIVPPLLTGDVLSSASANWVYGRLLADHEGKKRVLVSAKWLAEEGDLDE